MAISISNIVDVTVELSNPNIITSNFNLGLIIGSSEHITTTDRVKVYDYANYADQMTSDGFETTDPEYIAVSRYFAQSPTPSRVVVGVQGDSETLVQALTACRQANNEFFGCCFCDETTDADIPAVAAAVETFSTPTVFFFQTKDTNCLQASQTNVLATLQTAKYQYTCGNYSTQQYFVCGLLGVFCGLNSMQANSAYTMAFKTVVGFNPENINDTQYAALIGYNGNTYVQSGRTYQFYMKGLMANGMHVDEIYFICAAKFLIEENTLAGLISRRRIPQTEDGMTDIINCIATACEGLATMGVIATGIWTGESVLDLATGDAVPGGYYIQAETIASQSAADRAARVTPPIYVCLKGAGAIESVVIRVFVNR